MGTCQILEVSPKARKENLQLAKWQAKQELTVDPAKLRKHLLLRIFLGVLLAVAEKGSIIFPGVNQTRPVAIYRKAVVLTKNDTGRVGL